MYKSGDVVRYLPNGVIDFVGRRDFQVKIRGQRIELGEIENAIAGINGINMSAVVVRKDNQDRQLICAFYTGEEKSAKELKEKVGKTLPKYMIPHIFTHIDKMPLTSSEKINRNALPEVDLENIETNVEYVTAETEKEVQLTECIQKVLGTEKISMLDNFFDIGGDSLKAIELTARLEEKGYEVSVKTIFSCENIRELAEALRIKETVYTKVQYSDIIPATAAQMRVYTAQMMNADSTLYNILYVFRTDNIDADRLTKAVNRLIERHESLRTHFENQNGQIMQVIDDSATVTLEKLSGEDFSLFSKPFELTKSPLVHVGYSENTVMIELHHIIADGESMPVFFSELNELYMGRELQNIPVQYGEFAVQEIDLQKSEKYWLEVFRDVSDPLELPTDFARKETQSFNGTSYFGAIAIELQKLEAAGVPVLWRPFHEFDGDTIIQGMIRFDN